MEGIMEKSIAVAVFSALTLGSVDVERGGDSYRVLPPGASSELSSPAQLPGEGGGTRNLLLNAFGTRQPGTGEVRIPIPTDDAMYEVIVTKPGLPRSVPVAKDQVPR
jgi:hypothetical protein